MSIISLAELLAPRSAQQIINDSLSFLANPPDPNLVTVRTANWRTGGPYRTLLYRQGIEGSLLYQVLAAFAGSSFLRYASGKWLDWLGEDYFDEPRQGATPATVTLRLTVPLGAGPIGPIQIKAQTSGGLQFTSTALETIPAGPATFNFQATAAQAGAVYNVGANTITQLVTPNVLGISVTNPAAATGGFDAEPDARYAQRLRAKWGALSTGSTQAAYVYWALTASRVAQKVRVYSNNRGGVFTDNVVTVVAGTFTGGVGLAALTDIYNYIAPRVPLDIEVGVQDALPVSVNAQGLVKIFSVYASSAPAAISNSLLELQKRVPIGSYDQGPVPVSEVADAVFYNPSQVFDVALTVPAAPISLGYADLLVLANETTIQPV